MMGCERGTTFAAPVCACVQWQWQPNETQWQRGRHSPREQPPWHGQNRKKPEMMTTAACLVVRLDHQLIIIDGILPAAPPAPQTATPIAIINPLPKMKVKRRMHERSCCKFMGNTCTSKRTMIIPSCNYKQLELWNVARPNRDCSHLVNWICTMIVPSGSYKRSRRYSQGFIVTCPWAKTLAQTNSAAALVESSTGRPEQASRQAAIIDMS